MRQAEIGCAAPLVDKLMAAADVVGGLLMYKPATILVVVAGIPAVLFTLR